MIRGAQDKADVSSGVPTLVRFISRALKRLFSGNVESIDERF